MVFALGEGRFKSVTVALGRIDGEFAEIRSGLSVGERVVTSAQFLLDSESSKTSDFMRMQPASMNDAAIDRSTMNHGERNHREMSHADMNHSGMDGSAMKDKQSNHHEMENGND